MPNKLLLVSRVQQQAESDCLPACAQMVLAYLGKIVEYKRLLQLLRTRSFGTPAANILYLNQLGVRDSLREFVVNEIEKQIDANRAVIAFLNTADLPYWKQDTDHAVVVIGFDGEDILLNDPFYAEQTQKVSHAAFELAQLRFNHLCATIEL